MAISRGVVARYGQRAHQLDTPHELRDEASSKCDTNLAALWDWLARQVVEVRDNDGRVLQAAGRDFSIPAMGEN
jgi:hypothetical protein